MGELTVIVHLILWGIRSLIFFFFFLSAPFLTYSEPQLLLFLEKIFIINHFLVKVKCECERFLRDEGQRTLLKGKIDSFA